MLALMRSGLSKMAGFQILPLSHLILLVLLIVYIYLYLSSGERVDPGAARFGNFINYYEFNPAEERVSRLPGNLLRDLDLAEESVLGLDIGCNAGVCTFILKVLNGTVCLYFILK